MVYSSNPNDNNNNNNHDNLQDQLRLLTRRYGLPTVRESLRRLEGVDNATTHKHFPKDGNSQKTDAKSVPLHVSITSDVMEACFDAVIVSDDKGNVTQVNKAAYALFEYPMESTGNPDETIVGLPLSRLISGRAESPIEGDDASANTAISTTSILPPVRDQDVLVGRTKEGMDIVLTVRIHWIRETNSWVVVCRRRGGDDGNTIAEDSSGRVPVRVASVSKPSTPTTEGTDEDIVDEHALMQSILDSSFEAIVVVDVEGTIIKLNAALLKVFGFDSAEEVKGQNIAMMVGGDEQHRINHRDYMSNFHEREGVSTILGKQRELVARRKDGVEFPCKIGVRRVPNSNLLVGFIQDISHEVHALENEHVNQSILDSSFSAIVVAGLDGTIVKVNASTMKIFGFETNNQVVGQNISMLVGGDEGHSDRHHTYMKRFHARGATSTILGHRRQLQARRRNGTEFPCRIGVRKVEDSALLVGFIEDITHEKEVERGAQLNQSILDSSFDSIVVIGSEDLRIVKVNASLLTNFGFESSEEVVGEHFSMLVGGKDGDAKDQGMKVLIDDDGRPTLLGRKRESIAQRKDGSQFPCHIGLREVVGSKLFVAFIQDMTHEKEAEREEKINESILDSSFDAIVVADEEGTIVKVNASFLTIFRCTDVKNVIGKNISMLVGGKGQDAERHAGYLKRFKKRGGSSTVLGTRRTLVARRQDNSEFPCRIGVRKVPETELLVGFIQDISAELRNLELAVEKRAAEDLLTNMLPREIAARLKQDPGHIADSFQKATVLFGDIVGFTKMSNSLSPVQVVEFLNSVFSRFDQTLDKYGLNKVKTIGDCYMVTSVPGCKGPPRSCAAICHFAMDMIRHLEEYNEEHPDAPLHMRIGVNIGPVVAGVVGTKRFLYDIWGDAVNVASRMESTGVPGRVQVTPAVVETLKSLDTDEFEFEKRGIVSVKGIGEMETYLIKERDGVRTSKYFREVDAVALEKMGTSESSVELLQSIAELDFSEAAESETNGGATAMPVLLSTGLHERLEI